MNSPNELLPFFALPDKDKQDLLEDVVAGRLELSQARKAAEQQTSEARAFREVERVFNALSVNKTKHGRFVKVYGSLMTSS